MMTGGLEAGAVVSITLIAFKVFDYWFSRSKNSNGGGSGRCLWGSGMAERLVTEARAEIQHAHDQHSSAINDLFREMREHHNDEVGILSEIRGNTARSASGIEVLRDRLPIRWPGGS